MENSGTIFGQNLKCLIEKWSFSQQDLEGLLYLGRGIVSGYIAGRGYARPATLIRLEELTGIPIYRWLKTPVLTHEIPAAPLEYYLPVLLEPEQMYSTPTLQNTPLPVLLRSFSERLTAVEERLKNCQ